MHLICATFVWLKTPQGIPQIRGRLIIPVGMQNLTLPFGGNHNDYSNPGGMVQWHFININTSSGLQNGPGSKPENDTRSWGLLQNT